MINTYKSGSMVRSTVVFTNVSGALTDPTTTTFKYRAGASAVQTITGASITHESIGVFHFDIDTTGWSGPDNLLYTCQWQGTGNVQAIEDDFFFVTPPAL